MTNTTKKSTASAQVKLECTVAYDVITRSDMVRHFVETIRTASKASLYKHLRIKNKNLGLVRNINVLKEIQVA